MGAERTAIGPSSRHVDRGVPAGGPRPSRVTPAQSDHSGVSWNFSTIPVTTTQSSRPSEADFIPQSVFQVIRSAGAPLDYATRTFFERRMPAHTSASPRLGTSVPLAINAPGGQRERDADLLAERLTEPQAAGPPRSRYDLSAVRVHTDPVASASARELRSAAYAIGRHIVFGAGQYRVDLHAGRRLIAHELAHLTQPDAGSVIGRQDAGVTTNPGKPAGVAPPRPDYVFIMGADPAKTNNRFYREAERFYRARIPSATIVNSVRNLSGLLDWVNANVAGPVGNLYIVTHANEDGTVAFGLDPADQDKRVTVKELRNALHPDAGPSALPKLSGQIDPGTRIYIKGCDLGRTQAMVELIDEAFGGAGVVTAPTHEQEYGEDPVLKRRARERFEAQVASGYPKVPAVDPQLRGAARRQAQQQRGQALAERTGNIRAEIRSRQAEEGEIAQAASVFEALSGPMFQRPGTELFTQEQLSPMVAAQYPHLSGRQQAAMVSGLVAADRRRASVARSQGTYQQHGQRVDRRVTYTYRFDPGTQATTPDDATMIAEGRSELPNPERYAWRVTVRLTAKGETIKDVVAERVIAYLHHGSLDPSAHEHFTRPEDDPLFFTSSTFTPSAVP